MDFLSQGYAYTSIVQVLIQQYRLSERHAKRYIQLAQALLKGHLSDGSLQEHLSMLTSQAQQISRHAFQQKDMATALKSIEVQGKLIQDFAKMGGKEHVHAIASTENLSIGLEGLFDDLSSESEQLILRGTKNADKNKSVF